MNRSLSPGDLGHRGIAPGWASGPRRAVPSAGGLVGRAAAHSCVLQRKSMKPAGSMRCSPVSASFGRGGTVVPRGRRRRNVQPLGRNTGILCCLLLCRVSGCADAPRCTPDDPR